MLPYTTLLNKTACTGNSKVMGLHILTNTKKIYKKIIYIFIFGEVAKTSLGLALYEHCTVCPTFE